MRNCLILRNSSYAAGSDYEKLPHSAPFLIRCNLRLRGTATICPIPHTLPHHLPPGTVLKERYLIGRVLGEGGFGITYIGCDLQLEVKIAVKEYFPVNKVSRNAEADLSVSCYTGAIGDDFAQDLDRFLREARTMAKLQKQSTIVSIHDFFRENNTAYIVMEYIDGITFKDLAAQRGGKIPAWELLYQLEPLFFALQAMHEAGLIHRDISPENIMLENGVVRLLDFGCARDVNNDKTMTISLKHSYAPVEQYQGKGQGPWTDIYALGCTIYYCLTGVKPLQAMDRMVDDELVPPRKLGVDLTEGQEQALLKAIRVMPKRRYQSMQEFHAGLYEGMEKMKPPAPVEPVVVDEPTETEETNDSAELTETTEQTETTQETQTQDEKEEGLFAKAVIWVKKNPVITGACAAAILLILIIGVGVGVSQMKHDKGTADSTEDSGESESVLSETEEDESDEALSEAEDEDSSVEDTESDDASGVTTVTTDEGTSYQIRDGIAYVTDGEEASLLDALENEDVESVILRDDFIYVTEILKVNKPLTMEEGIYAASSVIVGEGGSITVDADGLCVCGLLMTMDGGTVTVTENGNVGDEYGTLLLESWDDLTVEDGGYFALGAYAYGESITEDSSCYLWNAVDEDALFADAVSVENEEDLRAAMDDDTVTAIDITGDITLSEAIWQTKAVRIAEGVTVVALGADQELDDDGNIVLHSDVRESSWNWNVEEGAVLINHGTLMGDLYSYGEEEDTTPCAWIINDGTIDISGQLSGCLINLEEGNFNLMHGYLVSGHVVNLGTFTHTPRLGEGLDYLYIESQFYTCGTVLLQGSEEITSYTTVYTGEMRIAPTGIVDVGENAYFTNACQLEVQGTLRALDGSETLNLGFISVQYVGSVQGQLNYYAGGGWTNNGEIRVEKIDRKLDAEFDGGSHQVLTGGDDYVGVTTAEELEEALNDNSILYIHLENDITYEGDLTIDGKYLVDNTLTINSGTLTVTDGGVHVSGLTLTGGSSLILTGDSTFGTDFVYADEGCSITVEDFSFLVADSVELYGTQVTINGGDEGRRSIFTALYGMELTDCTVTLNAGDSGAYLTNCGEIGQHGTTSITNNGGIVTEAGAETDFELIY